MILTITDFSHCFLFLPFHFVKFFLYLSFTLLLCLFPSPLLSPPYLSLSSLTFLLHSWTNASCPLLLHCLAISAKMKAMPLCFWVVLILSALKGCSWNTLVSCQWGEPALWVQQGRISDFPASAWTEGEGVSWGGCCEGALSYCALQRAESAHKTVMPPAQESKAEVCTQSIAGFCDLYFVILLHNLIFFFSFIFCSSFFFFIFSPLFPEPSLLLFNDVHSLVLSDPCWALLRSLLCRKYGWEGCYDFLQFLVTQFWFWLL